MNNADYWARRFKIMEDALKDQSYEYAKNLEQQFDSAIAQIDTQMRAWYQRFADNNGGMSYAQAQKLLTEGELKEFKWTVQEYIKAGKEHAVSGAWAKELENASARVHVSRLESLKIQLRQQAEELTQARIDATTDASKLAYTESYYHTAFEVQRGLGVWWTMQQLDTGTLQKVLSRPWTVDNQTFTARCWTDKTKLVETVNQELTRMLATGEAPDKAIEAIAKRFNVSKQNAGRVVMTESAYFSSAAQKDCFGDLDVEQYIIVSAIDAKTCEICGGMDGKIFKMSDFVSGSTAPPFHPWCRCTTAPYFADMESVGERYARDVKTGGSFKMSKDTTYKQWKEVQDAKYGTGTVDKTRKTEYSKSADMEQFERYKAVLKELSPKTLDEFQAIKHSDETKWSALKYQYRTVNQYKIDSGSLSVKEILDLDDKIISEKRNNFTSKYRRSGNIAGVYLDGDPQKLLIAHSKINTEKEATKYKGQVDFVTLKEQRIFDCIDVYKSDGSIRTQTHQDTEAKLFERLADMYEKKPFASVTMLSERGMCDSCKGVMAQFKEKYPHVTVNVVSNKRAEGDVWKHRRTKR